MSTSATSSLLLEMRDIHKAFPGVRALDGVHLTLHHGEVLALLGENGAGKSTLIKMLGGAHRPDTGSIRLSGEEVTLASPATAAAAGIGVIFQELNLVPELTAKENVFLGRERSLGFVWRGEEQRHAQELVELVGMAVPLDVPCSRLSVAQQQVVEIVKALAQDVRLLVMDEPTAALSPREVERLHDMIRGLARRGIGIIYISHRLDEVFDIADRVTVLRDGRYVGEAPIGELTREKVIEMMVGRQIENEFPKHHHPVGEPRLVVRNLRRASAVRGVSFEVRRGEVLGFTGLAGAGRTEVARLLFGADRADEGTIELDGIPLRLHSPRDAIRASVCLLTEDRKQQGLVLDATARENFALPNIGRLATWGFMRQREERSRFAHYIDKLKIRLSSQDQLTRNLSGGNQQKLVLAKWLERNAEVVIFDEPTRGIDVGAKFEIYLLINELAKQGKAIVMISSELPEVLGMSDRILVMHNGRVTGLLEDARQASQQQIMDLAVG